MNTKDEKLKFRKKIESKRYNDFTLVEYLGGGTFGAIYKVVQKATGDFYAVKFFARPQDFDEERRVNDLMRLLELESDGLALSVTYNIHLDEGDKYLEQGIPYIVYPLATNDMHHMPWTMYERYYGEVYDKALYQSIMNRFALQIFDTLIKKLREMHRHRIYHRDIKPDNILIFHKDNKNTFAFADFGSVCHIMEGKKRKNMDEFAINCKTTNRTTKWFACPEMLIPDAEYTSENLLGRNDLWSLGTSLYKIIVGKMPFDINKPRQYLDGTQEGVKKPKFEKDTIVPGVFLYESLNGPVDVADMLSTTLKLMFMQTSTVEYVYQYWESMKRTLGL